MPLPPSVSALLSPPPPPPDARELGRLRWRCRRGMKELDLLLTRYVEERFCSAPHPERDAFKELLETQDPLLHAYCLGSEPPPARFAALIEQITASSRGPG